MTHSQMLFGMSPTRENLQRHLCDYLALVGMTSCTGRERGAACVEPDDIAAALPVGEYEAFFEKTATPVLMASGDGRGFSPYRAAIHSGDQLVRMAYRVREEESRRQIIP